MEIHLSDMEEGPLTSGTAGFEFEPLLELEVSPSFFLKTGIVHYFISVAISESRGILY